MIQRLTSNKRLLIAAAVIIVAVIVVLVVVLSGDSNKTALAIEPGLISPAQYVSAFEDAGVEHFLLDVRMPEEFAGGHIEGAVNIPVQELDQHLSEIPTDQPVVLYCRTGNRSAAAAGILKNAGYSQVYDIDGGIVAWGQAGLPLQ